MLLGAARLVQHLISRGLVPRECFDAEAVRIFESRQRNRIYRVLRKRGIPLFIKELGVTVPETVLGLRREATCYQMAAEVPEFAELREIMPQLLDYDPASHTLVTEYFPESEDLNAQRRRTGKYPEWVGCLVADALVLGHSATWSKLSEFDQAEVFARKPPWVFSLPASGEYVLATLNQPVQQALAWLRQQPALRAGLTRLAYGWRQTCLIHGDLKWNNLLLRKGALGRPRLLAVDWELADIGDPAWDVGCGLAAYLGDWLLSLDLAFGLQSPGGFGHQAAWPAISAFWHGYRNGRGFSQEQAQIELLRSVDYAGGALVKMVFEMLQFAPQMAPAGQAVLRLAVELLSNPLRAQTEWLGLTGAYPIPTVASLDPEESVLPHRHGPELALVSTPLRTGGMPAPIRARLRTLFKQATFFSPMSFHFANGVAIQPPKGLEPAPEQLAEAIWPVFYWYCYTRRFPLGQVGSDGGASDENMVQAAGPDVRFLAELSLANRSRERWDPAWTVWQVAPNGAVWLWKGEACRLAGPGQFAVEGSGGYWPAFGATVALLVPREDLHSQPGFYCAFGESIPAAADEEGTSRLYFNIRANVVTWLLNFLSSELNHIKIPFVFKCLNNPAAYRQNRGDAAVLYLPRRFLGVAIRILATREDALRKHLNAEIPLFARELLPGLGGADDPGTGESFGQSRMRLVSRGLVDAWCSGHTDVRSRFDSVYYRFRAAGLSLQAPHLNPGKAEIYEWPA